MCHSLWVGSFYFTYIFGIILMCERKIQGLFQGREQIMRELWVISLHTIPLLYLHPSTSTSVLLLLLYVNAKRLYGSATFGGRCIYSLMRCKNCREIVTEKHYVWLSIAWILQHFPTLFDRIYIDYVKQRYVVEHVNLTTPKNDLYINIMFSKRMTKITHQVKILKVSSIKLQFFTYRDQSHAVKSKTLTYSHQNA